MRRNRRISRSSDGPARHGRRLDHSSPQPHDIENDISDGWVANTELPEEARQVRVVRLVVDDEPRVELEAGVRNRVGVAPRALGFASNSSTSWSRGERMRRAEPGDAGTDDRYLHLNGDSLETRPLDD